MSGVSWEAFAEALHDENRCLGELGAAALAMTSALVFGKAADIDAADRDIETQRVLHAGAHQRRAQMMKSAFGDRTLRQVCSYAPAPLKRPVFTTLGELRTRGVSLRITVGNNKALISAGLQRIANTIEVLQKSLTEQTGIYRRRGSAAPPNASVIVSRKA